MLMSWETCQFTEIENHLTSSLSCKLLAHPRRLCWSTGIPSCMSSILLIFPEYSRQKNTLIINFNLWQQEKNLPVQCVSDFAKTQTRMKNLRSLLTALSLILLLGGDCKRIEPTVPLVWPTFPVLDGFSLRRDLNMILIRITSWSSFRRSNGYL